MSRASNDVGPHDVTPPAGRHNQHRLLRIGVPVVASVIFASACSQSAAPSAALAGAPSSAAAATSAAARADRPIEALDFAVPNGSASADAVVSVAPNAGSTPPAAKTSATDSVSSLITELIAGRYDTAFTLLSPVEQERVGSSHRLAAEIAPLGWKSFSISASGSNSVTAEIVQTPRVSDIDGVIAPTATVNFPVAVDTGGYSATWTRRFVMAHHPDRSATSDAAVSAAALKWAAAAQQCSADSMQYPGGLIGVTGLADQLCKSAGVPVVESVGELDALDEPQPVIDGFGSAAFTWARVVQLGGPVAMNVVLAPDADRWVVVAIARPTLAAAASTASSAATTRSPP